MPFARSHAGKRCCSGHSTHKCHLSFSRFDWYAFCCFWYDSEFGSEGQKSNFCRPDRAFLRALTDFSGKSRTQSENPSGACNFSRPSGLFHRAGATVLEFLCFFRYLRVSLDCRIPSLSSRRRPGSRERTAAAICKRDFTAQSNTVLVRGVTLPALFA